MGGVGLVGRAVVVLDDVAVPAVRARTVTWGRPLWVAESVTWPVMVTPGVRVWSTTTLLPPVITTGLAPVRSVASLFQEVM